MLKYIVMCFVRILTMSIQKKTFKKKDEAKTEEKKN